MTRAVSLTFFYIAKGLPYLLFFPLLKVWLNCSDVCFLFIEDKGKLLILCCMNLKDLSAIRRFLFKN